MDKLREMTVTRRYMICFILLCTNVTIKCPSMDCARNYTDVCSVIISKFQCCDHTKKSFESEAGTSKATISHAATQHRFSFSAQINCKGYILQVVSCCLWLLEESIRISAFTRQQCVVHFVRLYICRNLILQRLFVSQQHFHLIF